MQLAKKDSKECAECRVKSGSGARVDSAASGHLGQVLQINEEMALLVDNFEVCTKMTHGGGGSDWVKLQSTTGRVKLQPATGRVKLQLGMAGTGQINRGHVALWSTILITSTTCLKHIVGHYGQNFETCPYVGTMSHT